MRPIKAYCSVCGEEIGPGQMKRTSRGCVCEDCQEGLAKEGMA